MADSWYHIPGILSSGLLAGHGHLSLTKSPPEATPKLQHGTGTLDMETGAFREYGLRSWDLHLEKASFYYKGTGLYATTKDLPLQDGVSVTLPVRRSKFLHLAPMLITCVLSIPQVW